MSSKKQKNKKVDKKIIIKEIKLGKTFGIKRVFDSIKFTIAGLSYAYKNEQSLWLHGFVTFLVVFIGMFLNLTFMNWAIIILASLLLLSIELLNTAIEATVDMVTKEYNEYAKIAKDCGSAAAGVAALAFFGIVIFIYVEKFIGMIG